MMGTTTHQKYAASADIQIDVVINKEFRSLGNDPVRRSFHKLVCGSPIQPNHVSFRNPNEIVPVIWYYSFASIANLAYHIE